MPKPSERIKEIFDSQKVDYYDFEDAILDYLDEEYEKKDEVVLTVKKGELSEYEALKEEIKKQAIKEFAEKITRDKGCYGYGGHFMNMPYYLIKLDDIKDTLKEYNIEL